MTDQVFTAAAIKWVRRGDYIVSPEKAAEIDAKTAEFESDRQEEIRQLEAEIALIDWRRRKELVRVIGSGQTNVITPGVGSCISAEIWNWMWPEYGRHGAQFGRILARLESALADLKRGMK